MTLRGKARVVIALAALLSIVAVVTVAVTLRMDEATTDRAARMYALQQSSSNLSESLVDQETGLRGYVITGDKSFLEPYEKGRQSYSESTDALDDILDPKGLALLDKVEASVSEWSDTFADPEVMRVSAGDPQASDVQLNLEGRQLFDEVRESLDDFDMYVDNYQRTEAEDQASQRENLTNGFVLVTLLVAFLLGTITFFADRGISKPVEKLRRSVRRVAEGDLDEPIVPTGGADVRDLAGDVDKMRSALALRLQEVERSNEALRQEGPAVLGLQGYLSPPDVERVGRVRVANVFEPVEGVLAGDCVEVVSLPGGGVGAFVLDVSGHGALPGVLALRAKQLLTAFLRETRSPGEALRATADNLTGTGELFLTAFVLVVGDDGLVSYANAGHPAGLVLQEEGIGLLEPTGPLVGVIPGVAWDEGSVQLSSGDVLLVHTDGLPELRVEGEFFGDDRVREVAEGARPGGPRSVVDACVEAAREFSSGRYQDDVTILAVAVD